MKKKLITQSDDLIAQGVAKNTIKNTTMSASFVVSVELLKIAVRSFIGMPE
jgi:hypothetical protein